jgi:hypothetical protein
VNAPVAQPGRLITLTWRLSAAPKRLELRYSPLVPYAPYDISTLKLPARASGRVTLRIPAAWGNADAGFDIAAMAVTLRVDDADSVEGSASTLTVPFACKTQWFVRCPTPACPSGRAEISPAAIQIFENGVMIWVERTRTIYALYHDGPNKDRYARYTDTWLEDQPESDPLINAPPSRLQPIRGFGKTWREQRLVETLDWALEPERAYTVTYQSGQYALKQAVMVMTDPNGDLLEFITDAYGPIGLWRKL